MSGISGSGLFYGGTRTHRMPEQAVDPIVVVDTGIFYVKDVSGRSEAFYKDSTGANVQITSGGSPAGGGTTVWTGLTDTPGAFAASAFYAADAAATALIDTTHTVTPTLFALATGCELKFQDGANNARLYAPGNGKIGMLNSSGSAAVTCDTTDIHFSGTTKWAGLGDGVIAKRNGAGGAALTVVWDSFIVTNRFSWTSCNHLSFTDDRTMELQSSDLMDDVADCAFRFKSTASAPAASTNLMEWGIDDGVGGFTSKTIMDKDGKITVGTAATYTPSNVSTDRSYDADSTTLDQVADVLGTLIVDLQGTGLIA